MSVEKINRTGQTSWRVRWREGDRNRARTFDLRRDALTWDGEVRRLRQLGQLHTLDAGTESLHEFVIDTWAPTYAAQLAPRTRLHYGSLFDVHLDPHLGSLSLRELTAERISRWQADRLKAGAGPVAVRHALELLGSILQRAAEAQRVPANPVRLVRRAPRPRRAEVRPLAPVTVEKMRRALAAPLQIYVEASRPGQRRREAHAMPDPRDPLTRHRDAVLVSVLAYAGLRPGEALGLRWTDVRDNTILVERSISLGEEVDTKTRAHRTVRLLAPLRADLNGWRLACGRPSDHALIFLAEDGGPWSDAMYQSWRRRSFARAVQAAGIERQTRPYDLRHSFASLLVHEGRSVIYVAKQLGHDPTQTLSRYGHVIDELEDAPRIDAEAAIRAAREADVPTQYPRADQTGA